MLVFQMPGSLFQDKDYTNLRYFYRRAYYLACIAAHVRKETADMLEIEKTLLHDNPLLPCRYRGLRRTDSGPLLTSGPNRLFDMSCQSDRPELTRWA